MSGEIDAHGQPFNVRFNRARRAERDLSELLGLAKGVLADGVVTEAEGGLVHQWVAGHPDAVEQWPVNVLHARLLRIFEDGRVDDAEQRDLAELLTALVGGQAGIIGGEDAASDLPIDRPPPSLVWTGSVFVFTGKFAFGPRSECERHVIQLGALCESSITTADELSPDRNVRKPGLGPHVIRAKEKAVQYRSAGQRLAIVNEDHWAAALD